MYQYSAKDYYFKILVCEKDLGIMVMGLLFTKYGCGDTALAEARLYTMKIFFKKFDQIIRMQNEFFLDLGSYDTKNI